MRGGHHKFLEFYGWGEPRKARNTREIRGIQEVGRRFSCISWRKVRLRWRFFHENGVGDGGEREGVVDAGRAAQAGEWRKFSQSARGVARRELAGLPEMNGMRWMIGVCWVATLLPVRAGDFLEFLGSRPGVVHEDAEHPWLQELVFTGRVHWQYAGVFGRSEAADGSEESFEYGSRGEFRRVYFGPTIRFLEVFRAKVEANWVSDAKPRNGDRDFGYQSLFEGYLTVDLKGLLDWHRVDGFSVGYGVLEMKFTEEHMTSSRDLMTVERAMLDSWLLPGVPSPQNPTGVWFEWKQGRQQVSGGVLSTSASRELAGWDDGTVQWLTWRRDMTDLAGSELAEMSANFSWNDTGEEDAQAVNYDWAATLWGRLGEGRWSLRGTLIGGENRLGGEPGGRFGGVDLLATWWLVPERWQLALRCEVALAGEPEGLRLAGRYARIAGEPANEDIPALAEGRGDRHVSLYAGVTWFAHHPNLRVMAGIEWERMERSDRRQVVYEGITPWLAARIFF